MSKDIVRIIPTQTTPSIIIDYGVSYAKISGKSIPEDAYDFYHTVTQKLISIPELELDIDFEYLNSASLRYMTFLVTSELNLKKVIWYYEEDDTDMCDKALMIKDIINKEKPGISFQVIEK